MILYSGTWMSHVQRIDSPGLEDAILAQKEFFSFLVSCLVWPLSVLYIALVIYCTYALIIEANELLYAISDFKCCWGIQQRWSSHGCNTSYHKVVINFICHVLLCPERFDSLLRQSKRRSC